MCGLKNEIASGYREVRAILSRMKEREMRKINDTLVVKSGNEFCVESYPGCPLGLFDASQELAKQGESNGSDKNEI